MILLMKEILHQLLDGFQVNPIVYVISWSPTWFQLVRCGFRAAQSWAHLLKGLGQGIFSVANAVPMQLQWLGGPIQPVPGQDVLQAEPGKVVPCKELSQQKNDLTNQQKGGQLFFSFFDILIQIYI